MDRGLLQLELMYIALRYQKGTLRPSWWLGSKEYACQRRKHGFAPSSQISHATVQLIPCNRTTDPALEPWTTTPEPTCCS